MREISLPEGVTAIGFDALKNCVSLKAISLPDSIREIGDGVFQGCDALSFNEYKGAKCSVFHFDMYRIEDEDELYSIGFYDYFDRNGICLTEWSENIEYALPEAYIRATIKKCSDEDTDMRELTLELC